MKHFLYEWYGVETEVKVKARAFILINGGRGTFTWWVDLEGNANHGV